jgi:tetratricopeptide (TPR) repeat protein
MQFQQAVMLHRQGQIDQAAQAYEQILGTDPAHLDALIYLGALRVGQGRPDEAEQLLRRAVSLAPESPEALANLAAALQAQGRHDAAIGQFRQALSYRAELTEAWFGLAACLQAIGQDEDAILAYQAILDADPNHPEAAFGFATVLDRLGRSEAAEQHYRVALAADPDFAEASLGLGRLCARGTRPSDAIEYFEQALDVDPDYVEARLALANLLLRLHRDDAAQAAFNTVLATEPDNAAAQNGIGIILGRQRRHTEALAHYRAMLHARPADLDAMGGVATALKNLREDLGEAEAIARQIVSVHPDHAQGLGLLGSILAETGSIDEAQRLFRRAAFAAPNRPDFAYHLVQVAKVRAGDEVLRQLEAMLQHIGSYATADQCEVLFALAKAYDDIGERERGFDYLLRANALKRSDTEYREKLVLGAMDRIAHVFSAELLAARAGQGFGSEAPVFVVGMPRSGTTLVEQVLASHRDVFGAGERSELGEVTLRVCAERIGAGSFPEIIWTLNATDLSRMGADYVAALRPLAPAARRIVDKMPVNFSSIGLIRLILPNAKIIHTRRDPIDTCLSIFSKLFSGDQGFSYDLAELGRYYSAYRRLMAHWRDLVPADVMLEVEYEDMVQDFESQARRIIDHVGLPWDPACLEFYKTERPVHTASMTQVRQPIYRTSMGRWRPDPTLLHPLLEALGSPPG